MKKILVTGGAGFIGSYVSEQLLETGYSVVVLDDFSTGQQDNLACENTKLEIIRGSITDEKIVSSSMNGCDAVIHLAAIASVQASIENPVVTHQTNFDGTLILLNEARRRNIKRFLFASSAAVYGDATEGAIPEAAPLKPISPYAIDKLSSEYYLKHFSRSFGMSCTSFRFFNVYGPRQDPKSPYSGVISIFMDNCMADRVLKIFGDGNQTRDFVYVKDVSRILVDALENTGLFVDTINIGSGQSTSLNDLVESIAGISGKEIKVEYFDARSGDIRHSLADIRLLKSLQGCLRSATPFESGLRETVDQLLS